MRALTLLVALATGCTLSSTSITSFGAPCSADVACAHDFTCDHGACVPASAHGEGEGANAGEGEGEGEGQGGEGEGEGEGAVIFCGTSCDCPPGETCINTLCQSFPFPACASDTQCARLANGACGSCVADTKLCAGAAAPGLLASLTWSPLDQNPDLDLIAAPFFNDRYCVSPSEGSNCVDVVGGSLAQICDDFLECGVDECSSFDSTWDSPAWDHTTDEASPADPFYVDSVSGSEAEVIGVDAPPAGKYLIAIFYCGSSSSLIAPTEQYTLNVTTRDETRQFTGAVTGDASAKTLFEIVVVHVYSDGSTCFGDVRPGAVDDCQ